MTRMKYIVKTLDQDGRKAYGVYVDDKAVALCADESWANKICQALFDADRPKPKTDLFDNAFGSGSGYRNYDVPNSDRSEVCPRCGRYKNRWSTICVDCAINY